MPKKNFSILQRLKGNFVNRELMKYFDWPLLIIVLCIALFGVVCIFSATSSQVTEAPANVIEMIQTQSTYYAGSQLRWIGISLIIATVFIAVPYSLFGDLSNLIYLGILGLLVLTLMIARAGRGGMTAFLSWGNDHGFQTSEFGKIAVIIALAKLFSQRKAPVTGLHELVPLIVYIFIPILLVVLQPDFGTAMVYAAIFIVMVFVSGIDRKMIIGVLLAAAVLVYPLIYYINNSASESFRLTRILIWLNPEAYPDDARQVINAQIAIGSGGLFGKGIVSPGSFASLGYISDDHTDFIFAIVCESFGIVGGMALIAAYMVLLGRLFVLALRTEDSFGAYIIVGVLAMLLFHVLENIGMVIGIFPVTGIPLPFVSYGGSNLLTNLMGIALVLNVVMRDRAHKQQQLTSQARVDRI